MDIVDQSVALTVQPAESFELAQWRSCGKKENGRGGLGRFTVAGFLVSNSKDITATVAQIMALLALSVLMSFRGFLNLKKLSFALVT